MCIGNPEGGASWRWALQWMPVIADRDGSGPISSCRSHKCQHSLPWLQDFSTGINMNESWGRWQELGQGCTGIAGKVSFDMCTTVRSAGGWGSKLAFCTQAATKACCQCTSQDEGRDPGSGICKAKPIGQKLIKYARNPWSLVSSVMKAAQVLCREGHCNYSRSCLCWYHLTLIPCRCPS